MRQFEFEERVKMHVSQKEYEAIEEVYMNSDLDKDEFCKMWVKMNKSRVKEAQEQEKKRQEASELKDKAWELYFKLRDAIIYDFDKWSEYCHLFLSQKEQALLEKLGMTFTWKQLGTLKYELAQFLGIINA